MVCSTSDGGPNDRKPAQQAKRGDKTSLCCDRFQSPCIKAAQNSVLRATNNQSEKINEKCYTVPNGPSVV